jgi:hypothetical protein
MPVNGGVLARMIFLSAGIRSTPSSRGIDASGLA